MRYINEKLSGNIWIETDKYSKDGFKFKIKLNQSQSWGLPVEDINPQDLRVLADKLEELRA